MVLMLIMDRENKKDGFDTLCFAKHSTTVG